MSLAEDHRRRQQDWFQAATDALRNASNVDNTHLRTFFYLTKAIDAQGRMRAETEWSELSYERRADVHALERRIDSVIQAFASKGLKP